MTDSALAWLLGPARGRVKVETDPATVKGGLAAPHSREALGDLLGSLYRQARSLAGPRPDLDDIVQAAAERVLKALGRFEGRSELSTFTYGVVWRTLLDHDRWQFRFRRRFVLADEGTSEVAADDDSERSLVEARRARRLEQALSGLPPAKRAVLVLHDVEGYSASEVAKIVGTKEGTVRSRLRDARHFVAERLRSDPLFDEETTP